MLSGALLWLVNLMEVVVVALAILLSGLIIGMAAFWALARVVGKLSGQTSTSDLYEEEGAENFHPEVVSIRPDEDPPSTEPKI